MSKKDTIMETWMIIILVVGAVIMFSVWGLIALGNRELKKKEQQANSGGNQGVIEWENKDDRDDSAVYDTDGKRIR